MTKKQPLIKETPLALDIKSRQESLQEKQAIAKSALGDKYLLAKPVNRTPSS